MRTLGFRKQLLTKDITLLLVAVSFLVLAGTIHYKNPKPIWKVSKQDTAINVNKDLLIFLSAGNKRLFSDLVWVQTLLESDLEQYSGRDLNNWLFLRFITVQALDPNFYENYVYGGQFLSIIKDDIEGANFLYKKGVEKFPDDFQINFQAGFMNYFEAGDFKEALKYLNRIENHPKSPTYLKSIITKLKLGLSRDLEATFKLVLLNYQTTKDKNLKLRLAKDLYAIKAQIDLECLNSGISGCSEIDLNGEKYIKTGNEYQAPIRFLKYEIKIRDRSKK